jgi:hypothetical protein
MSEPKDIGLDEYVRLSDMATDQRGDDTPKAIAELVNSLARTAVGVGGADPGNKEKLKEHLGDTLWHLAAITRRIGVPLSEAARTNLKKIDELFGGTAQRVKYFDDTCEREEQLPRILSIEFKIVIGGDVPKVKMVRTDTGQQIGSHLDDNAHVPDHYRYHDVLHLAYMARLGWSPVMRVLFNAKRKAPAGDIDRVEDGARATLLEEALTGFIYAQAEDENFFEGRTELGMELLRTVKKLTRGLEVRVRTYKDWTDAILMGYKVFRELTKHRIGFVHVNMLEQTLTFQSPTNS